MTSMSRSRFTPFSAETGTTSRNACLAASSAVNGSSLPFVRDLVDLVDDDDGIAAAVLDALEHGRVFLAEAQGFDHEDHEVRIGQRGGRRAVHGAVERATLAQVQAGRVDEGELHARAVQHAQHAMPRGLRARRHDGQLFADERVQQRGFADVGTADDRREPGAKCGALETCTPIAFNAACAATCSARRRLGPSPSVSICRCGHGASHQEHLRVRLTAGALHAVQRQRPAIRPAGAPAGGSWHP